MDRKTFLKSAGTIVLGSMALGADAMNLASEPGRESAPASRKKYDFPLYDLHIHRSDSLSADDIVRKSKESGFESVGIMQNVAPWGIQSDEDLQRFIDEVKDYPCYMGLQPAQPGWSKNLSKDLIDQVDYVLMDPQYMPDGNKYGDRMELWEHTCYVDDEEDFMQRSMEWYMKILAHKKERLDILGWPLFLPPCIARDYYRLWTVERQEQIIEAARDGKVAIEINDLAHTPHPEFILRAKKAGLKFTFGSDTRDHRSFRLDYCKEVASLCGLTEKDFYVPSRKRRR